jgi:TANFOR domain-containing protein
MVLKKTITKIFSVHKVCLIVVALFVCTHGYAQLFPVQVTPQLIPPYSVYLSDYATPGNEKLRVIVLHRDISQPAYQIRLVMSVEWNGRVIMRTSRTFNPAPISINPGVPMVISGAELAPYLDSRNIDFVGYNREQYERTRSLPEGSYRITFVAYDYRRQEVQLSGEGNSFYYLSKNEPPLINYPACGTKIAMKTPQQIVFSWLPRNTASPNSVQETEYEFLLYETRPVGRNPNDVVLTTQPVFRTRTNLTQLIYGPAEPLLLKDINYVWRVQAIDRNGRDAFRNSGYSEVCTFSYTATDQTFDIGVVKDLRAVAETENKAKVTWTTGFYDGYSVEYKKTGQGYEWFKNNTTTGELKIFDLEPDTEYEARVIARKNGYFGPYSEVVKFRTNVKNIAHCGETPGLPDVNNPGLPLTTALTGMTINARGMEMTLMQVMPSTDGGDGWYKGYGRVTMPYLGASYPVKFDRIFINENRDVVFGRVDVISKGMAELIEEQIASNTKPLVTTSNDSSGTDTEFHEKIFEYNDIVIESVTVNAAGDIEIKDAQGNITINTEIAPILIKAPEQTVIIEDKDGNKWEITKNGATKQQDSNGKSSKHNQEVDSLALDEFGKLLLSVVKEMKITNSAILDSLRDEFSSTKKTIYENLNSGSYEIFLYAGLNDEYLNEGMSKKFKVPNDEKLQFANAIDKGILSLHQIDLIILKKGKEKDLLDAYIQDTQFSEFSKDIREQLNDSIFNQASELDKKKILNEEVLSKMASHLDNQ